MTSPTPRGSRSALARLLTVAACALALVATPATVSASPAHADPAGSTASSPPTTREDGHWVTTWTAMPQLTEESNMPPPPFTGTDSVLVDSTLRQTVRVSTGGERIRLSFSNEFGGAPLPLTQLSVALPLDGRAGASAVEPGSSQPLTFGGRASVTIPVGARYVSDPLDLPLEPGTILTVSAYLAEGQASRSITSHPGSRTTSHLTAGNHVDAADLPGATPVDHWYFLSAIEAFAAPPTATTAVLGDSLTDGRGSTTNGNDRWTDQFFDRLQAAADTDHIAVGNQAAGGNRVLHDGLGPSAISRLDRDVLGHSGVNRLILFEGVNDLGTAEATEPAQHQVVDALLTAYDQIITRARAHGLQVYGATLLPFGGNESYDDPQGVRESARQEVNTWIRTSGRFDAVLDFDAAVRDPQQPERLAPSLHDGDWLHLNPEGYGVLADSVPLGLFQH